MDVKLVFPHDLPQWPVIEENLHLLLEEGKKTEADIEKSFSCLASVYYAYHKKKGDVNVKETPFAPLKNYFEIHADEEDLDNFLTKCLPTIAKLALEAGSLRPEGFSIIRQQQTANISLTRHFVASVVAVGFLCMFEDIEEKYSLSLPNMNFTNFFWMNESQMAKLQMILNYFHRLSNGIPEGEIMFRRIVLTESDKLEVKKVCSFPGELCPFITKHDGKIEDAGTRVLQMDFANEYLGGGVLFSGNVQEEIRFSICPELLASMLFMQSMASNEAVVIEGFEQYSEYVGYGGSLKYAGNCEDPAAESSKRDSKGNIQTAVSAIDAIPYAYGGYGDTSEQFRSPHLTRDLNKAYAGFLQPYADKLAIVPESSDPEWFFNLDPTKKRTIATGNWGCGVFGGNAQLKSMLQWIAASKAGCPALVYYTFADKNVADLHVIVEKIHNAGWRIGDLMQNILKYAETLSKNNDVDSLFQFLSSLIDQSSD